MTDTATVAALIAMRELLGRPGGWGQLYYAIDAEGRSCSIDSPSAISFCLSGAVRKCGRWPWGHWHAIKNILMGKQIMDWNDTPGRTQADVVAVIDAAIAQERAGQ